MSRNGLVPGDRVFGFAGYLIESVGLDGVLQNFASVKAAEGLAVDDPVKHSIDKRVGKVFGRHYGQREASEKFQTAKARAFDISLQTLESLAPAGARVLASVCWPFTQATPRDDLSQWAFENLLQRLGMLLKSAPREYGSVVVVADRPENDAMYESFVDAVYHGRTTRDVRYLSGPLERLGVAPTLMFSSTPHSAPLQVADYVARACRDFIAWCHDERKIPKLFLPIIPALHRSPAGGGIDRVGFVIEPAPTFTVDEKVAQLLARGISASGSS